MSPRLTHTIPSGGLSWANLVSVRARTHAPHLELALPPVSGHGLSGELNFRGL